MNRLKILRKSRGMTQKEIAEFVGISQNNYSYWENEKVKIDNDSLQKLANFFGVTIDYILCREIPSNVYDVNGITVFDEIGAIFAGYDKNINEEKTGRKVEIPTSMLCGRSKDNYFVLRVSGNSMYPRLLDGDTILCWRCSSVNPGDIAVIIYDSGVATIKRVNYIEGQNWLELISFNPEYPLKRIEGTDLEQCRILGKVIKLIRDV